MLLDVRENGDQFTLQPRPEAGEINVLLVVKPLFLDVAKQLDLKFLVEVALLKNGVEDLDKESVPAVVLAPSLDFLRNFGPRQIFVLDRLGGFVVDVRAYQNL